MTLIKICGITNKKDAIAAAMAGIDMIGFVFYAESKRYVAPRVVEDIANELPPHIGKVGVFVDEKIDEVRKIAEDAGLDILQFHGNETAKYCENFRDDYKVIKAFRVKNKESLKTVNDYNVDFYLFDTFMPDTIGGTGEVFDWKILKDAEILKPMIISGGLTPANVQKAIAEVSPYGVDTSSGVEESPGRKDILLMKKFVENVRKA